MTMSTTTAAATLAFTTHPAELNGHILTSWIPMTTAWPSSSGCESSFWKYVPQTLAAWDPGYGLFAQLGLSCLPPEMTSWWNAGSIMSTVDLDSTQYSIGPIVCPEAYYTATTFVNAGSSTQVACCPSSYDFIHIFSVGNTGQCTSKVKVGQVVKYATRNSASKWLTSTSTVNKESVAFGIQMNGWLFPAESTSSTQTSASNTSSSTSEPDSSGLSTGAKAGIGIGIGLGVIVIAAVVGALLFRRQSRKRKMDNEGGTQESAYGDVPLSEAYGSSPISSEVYGSSPKSNANVAELPEANKPVEMP
ncbi:Fc.00g032690.m01.CDS01 [Cosmosporella sp. VM-42]